MANNYTESSSFIEIKKDKLEKAKEIVARVVLELEESEDEYAGFVAEIDSRGVWIHYEESIILDHAATLVKALVEELDLPGIHVCSWSHNCSKHRIDEFGGGAFAAQKGAPTVWVDASEVALSRAQRLKEQKDKHSQQSPTVNDLYLACKELTKDYGEVDHRDMLLNIVERCHQLMLMSSANV